MRERWLVSIYKEIENFLQNMAIEDADPSLVVKWKSSGRWPLPCQMIGDLRQPCLMGRALYEYYKSRCSTPAIDAQSSMFSRDYMVKHRHHQCLLNADIHDDDTVLVTPPAILVRMDIVKPNTVWHVKRLLVYGRRSETRSFVI